MHYIPLPCGGGRGGSPVGADLVSALISHANLALKLTALRWKVLNPSLKTINKSNIRKNNDFIYINISFILINISLIYSFLRGNRMFGVRS